jgi:hypothetical protein
MKKYIIFTFTLWVTFLVSAQVKPIDSTNVENTLNAKILLQESLFNKKLASFLTVQQNRHDSILKIITNFKIKSKISQSKIDSLQAGQIISLERLKELKNQVSLLEYKLSDTINSLKTKTLQLDVDSKNLFKEITSAQKEVTIIAKSSSNNSNSIDTVNRELSQKQQYGFMIFGLFLIIVLMVYVILTRRQNTNTKKIAAKQQEIFEKQIQDGQHLTDWLSRQTTEGLSKNSDGEVDHSFAKRVADEIVRITTNLSRMDVTVRGHKQLSASVRKLEQSLNSNNYELEALLNKPYDNGMNLQANFVIDENLQEGESVITRVIKPQINYKGKLIQAAQVEVSQGE